MKVLIDDFVGDPQELYNLVVEEVNRRQLPDIKYDWRQEGETIGLLSMKGNVTNALQISFRGLSFHVLGHQIGRCFAVTSRITVRPSVDPKAGYLRDLALDCFRTVVARSVSTAVARHLENRSAPVPEALRQSDIFFIPDPAAE